MWLDIEGHDEVAEQFRRILARGRLASTFLFVGPAGVGKRTFALRLAQTLVCQERRPELLDPCGKCPSCVQIVAGTYPDLLQVGMPKEKNFIPVELIVGRQEHRMQEGLCHDIWQKPLPGSRRMAIIDDADFFNEEGANALLKTLEEPPPGAIVFLIGTNIERQLPTIRSRSQIIRFRPLAPDVSARVLMKTGRAPDAATARQWAELANGSLDAVETLASEDLQRFRQRWLELLAAAPFDQLTAAKMLLAYADEAGKEASAKRERIRPVFEITTDFFAAVSRRLVGGPASGAPLLTKAAADAALAWPDEELAALCVERTLTARETLDRFINQANVIECWLDDLAREQSAVLAR
ncbi:MAG: hypothetical protein JSS27_17130 [Planctomycetes bacterium]|nr:hypothetical protein [Planctomycetota bacterium]